jgi:hypothetical protein
MLPSCPKWRYGLVGSGFGAVRWINRFGEELKTTGLIQQLPARHGITAAGFA